MNIKTYLTVCSIALGLGVPVNADLQLKNAWASEPLDRFGRAEVYGIGQYLHSDRITFTGPMGDVHAEMHDTGLGGMGFAFHFNQFLSVRTEFMFGGATFHARVPTESGGELDFDQDALLHTGRLNLDYNIINRRLTPFVTAGIGYQYLEAELDYLPPTAVCWWDPWWGWVCTYGRPVVNETDFTWNAGAGLRWDVTDNLFVKALGGANWVQYSDARNITTQIEATFSLGWTF